jgi:hypothetical protein
LVGFDVTGFGHEVFRLNRPQSPLFHEAANATGSAHQRLIPEFLADATITVAAPMRFEDGLDPIAHLLVGSLRGRFGGRVIKTAASKAQGLANLPQTGAG